MGFFGLFRSLDKGQGMEVSVMDVQLDGVPGGLGPLRGEATQAATAEAGDGTASSPAPGKLVRPQSESCLQTRLPPRNSLPASATLRVSEKLSNRRPFRRPGGVD